MYTLNVSLFVRTTNVSLFVCTTNVSFVVRIVTSCQLRQSVILNCTFDRVLALFTRCYMHADLTFTKFAEQFLDIGSRYRMFYMFDAC